MSMSSREPRYSAIVLAGDRSSDDPVASAAEASCKALAEIGGQPMLWRVIDTLRSSSTVDEILVCGPPTQALESDPTTAERLESLGVVRVGLESTPTRSVMRALNHIDADKPVLITTADHALLTSEMVDHFTRSALEDEHDALLGLARYRDVEAAYPNIRRTVTRLSDDGYCGCNLFALTSPSARKAVEFWTRIEHDRKKPMRVVAALGWSGIALYAIGRLSLTGALSRLSKKLGIRVGGVIMPFAEAAIDVDTPADLELVRNIIARREDLGS
jgi:GTP:adenosylcobinamide-phosphate guanylyltransferase